ncbi:MAG: YggT family protein [Parcubacteria group bacterium CG11_big_fil_rev_8_21_14_0_20_39_22]|nr:MAG: YggT family protein [Parcubacteria group bacterium CG11_big_fil_rev_8_21_14_0_20_39_22]
MKTFYSEDLIVKLVNFFVGLVETVLVLRLLLRLFGANPATPFVNWIYAMSSTLLEPFRGIFPTAPIEGGFAIEFSTLFAMVAYAIAGWIVVEIISIISDWANKSVEESEETREIEEREEEENRF